MVFLFYMDSDKLIRCGSDFTWIMRERKTPKITKKIIDKALKLKSFKKAHQVTILGLSYHKWSTLDIKDFKEYALSKYTV